LGLPRVKKGWQPGGDGSLRADFRMSGRRRRRTAQTPARTRARSSAHPGSPRAWARPSEPLFVPRLAEPEPPRRPSWRFWRCSGQPTPQPSAVHPRADWFAPRRLRSVGWPFRRV